MPAETQTITSNLHFAESYFLEKARNARKDEWQGRRPCSGMDQAPGRRNTVPSSSISQLLISGATEEPRRSWRKVGSVEADDNTRAQSARHPVSHMYSIRSSDLIGNTVALGDIRATD